MKNTIIVGAGDAGKELLSLIESDSQCSINVLGFIDDTIPVQENFYLNKPIISNIKDFKNSNNDTYFICSITNHNFRKHIIETMLQKGCLFTNFIHHTALVNSSLLNNVGIIIYPFSVISNNVVISDHVFINMHTTIGHNAVIGKYSVISSHCDITGHVRIGQENFLGSHVTLVPKTITGSNVTIGIGSVVISDIKDNSKVFGNPARIYKL